MSETPKSIIVIGAGIAGVASALFLPRDGHTVTILDPRGVGEGASFGNAGTIAPTSCVPTARPDTMKRVPKMLLDPAGSINIRWSYLPKLAPWLIDLIRNSSPEKILANAKAKTALLEHAMAAYNELIADAQSEDMIVRNGILQVFETDQGLKGMERDHALIKECGHKIEFLPGEEIRQMEPAFSQKFKHAVYIENHATIKHPGDLTKKFAAHFEAKGGAFLQEQVTGLTKAGAAWSVITDKETTAPPRHCCCRCLVAGVPRCSVAACCWIPSGAIVMLPQPNPALRRPVLLGDQSVFLCQ